MEGDQLRKALEGLRPELEAGLCEAESELAQLDARREELLDLMQRAKYALGLPGTSEVADGGARGQTLHEALAQILRENRNQWMTAPDLTDQVNRRGLYKKRNGTGVEVNQVHARTNNYSELFEKLGGRIRLRDWQRADRPEED